MRVRVLQAVDFDDNHVLVKLLGGDVCGASFMVETVYKGKGDLWEVCAQLHWESTTAIKIKVYLKYIYTFKTLHYPWSRKILFGDKY